MFSFGDNAERIDCAYPIIKETIGSSELGYGTNNAYPKFPPLMADGRAVISSWQPESVVNDKLIKSNDIKTNWEYRKYLAQHSTQVIEYNFRETCNDTGYFIPPLSVGSTAASFNNTPYAYKTYNETSKPNGYEDSDLKQLYLSREQLNAKRVAPQINQ